MFISKKLILTPQPGLPNFEHMTSTHALTDRQHYKDSRLHRQKTGLQISLASI